MMSLLTPSTLHRRCLQHRCSGGLLAEAWELLEREDDLDRHLEERRDAERQVQARAEFPAFEIADRLIVHAHTIREVAAGDASFGAEHRDALVHELAGGCHQPHPCIALALRPSTAEPDSLRAIARSTR